MEGILSARNGFKLFHLAAGDNNQIGLHIDDGRINFRIVSQEPFASIMAISGNVQSLKQTSVKLSGRERILGVEKVWAVGILIPT